MSQPTRHRDAPIPFRETMRIDGPLSGNSPITAIGVTAPGVVQYDAALAGNYYATPGPGGYQQSMRPLTIPHDRTAIITGWAVMVWDRSANQPLGQSQPSLAVIFRLHLQGASSTDTAPEGQSVIVASQKGAADSGMVNIPLLNTDGLLATWRGIATNCHCYCRVTGYYTLV
jgi:hypothetical protein